MLFNTYVAERNSLTGQVVALTCINELNKVEVGGVFKKN